MYVVAALVVVEAPIVLPVVAAATPEGNEAHQEQEDEDEHQQQQDTGRLAHRRLGADHQSAKIVLG
jgi:type II secretory pathway pseudopilin PulG